MILEKLKSIIAERWEIEPDELDENTSFEDLGADSLDIVELIMILEEEFKIEIADEDAEGLSTIGELVEYIEDKV